jgi:signal transduction histidine kinase
MRRSSLTLRLVVLAGICSLLVLVVAGVALSVFFNRAAQARFDRGIAEQIDNLSAGVGVDADGTIIAPTLADTRTLRGFSGKYWSIATPTADGGLAEVVRSVSLVDAAPLPPPRGGAEVLARQPGTTVFYNAAGPDEQQLRVGALQVRLPRRTGPVVLLAAEDIGPLKADSRRFTLVTLVILAALGAGLVLTALLQVRIGLQPLFALRREVAAVRRGKAERLAREYPVDLQPLANELNALVAHNQEVVERQRTHVGNLAHALKTPLSVMLTEAAQQPGKLAEVVSRQAEVMREQVDHHLRRARAAARAQSLGERTEVAPVLDELARTLEKIFRSKGVVVDWRAEDDLYFQGEKQDLLEMAGNVMENAAKWCAGRVRVTAEPISPERLRMVVEDDGPGLPTDRREEVLRRGARLDESAPGSGLGLAIVDDLARAYGGAVSLGTAGLGGLRVDLELPRIAD